MSWLKGLFRKNSDAENTDKSLVPATFQYAPPVGLFQQHRANRSTESYNTTPAPRLKTAAMGNNTSSQPAKEKSSAAKVESNLNHDVPTTYRPELRVLAEVSPTPRRAGVDMIHQPVISDLSGTATRTRTSDGMSDVHSRQEHSKNDSVLKVSRFYAADPHTSLDKSLLSSGSEPKFSALRETTSAHQGRSDGEQAVLRHYLNKPVSDLSASKENLAHGVPRIKYLQEVHSVAVDQPDQRKQCSMARPSVKTTSSLDREAITGLMKDVRPKDHPVALSCRPKVRAKVEESADARIPASKVDEVGMSCDAPTKDESYVRMNELLKSLRPSRMSSATCEQLSKEFQSFEGSVQPRTYKTDELSLGSSSLKQSEVSVTFPPKPAYDQTAKQQKESMTVKCTPHAATVPTTSDATGLENPGEMSAPEKKENAMCKLEVVPTSKPKDVVPNAQVAFEVTTITKAKDVVVKTEIGPNAESKHHNQSDNNVKLALIDETISNVVKIGKNSTTPPPVDVHKVLSTPQPNNCQETRYTAQEKEQTEGNRRKRSRSRSRGSKNSGSFSSLGRSLDSGEEVCVASSSASVDEIRPESQLKNDTEEHRRRGKTSSRSPDENRPFSHSSNAKPMEIKEQTLGTTSLDNDANEVSTSDVQETKDTDQQKDQSKSVKNRRKRSRSRRRGTKDHGPALGTICSSLDSGEEVCVAGSSASFDEIRPKSQLKSETERKKTSSEPNRPIQRKIKEQCLDGPSTSNIANEVSSNDLRGRAVGRPEPKNDAAGSTNTKILKGSKSPSLNEIADLLKEMVASKPDSSVLSSECQVPNDKSTPASSQTKANESLNPRPTRRERRNNKEAKPTKGQPLKVKSKNGDAEFKNTVKDLVKELLATPPVSAHSVEVIISERISKENVVQFLKNQYLSDHMQISLENHELKDKGTVVVISFTSNRKALMGVKQLTSNDGVLQLSAKILKRQTPVISLETLVKEHTSYAMEHIRTPLSEHQNKITRLMEALMDKTSPVDQQSAIKSKLEELQNQQAMFMQFFNEALDATNRLTDEDKSSRDKLKQMKLELRLEIQKLKTALPMYAKKEAIVQKVKNNQVSIILGETGSGKSTQMAQYLHQAGFTEHGSIVCTQPRKVAALSVAQRVAEEMGTQVGHLVGYKTGTQGKMRPETKVLYMTDHCLLNECLQDPQLSRYACIIVDEAHERSIYTDLLLGMIKKILPSRPELRVIITSATIDPKIFVDYFGCDDALRVSGRAFPVQVSYERVDCEANYKEKAVEKAIEIHNSQPTGDVLVFLTSPLETEKASELFVSKMRRRDVVCLQLHGQQQPVDQRKVFEATLNRERKVVFATNCAETSITIPGIKYVVDTGLGKEMKFDAKRSMSTLEVGWISKSSAEQRKGRAGRIESGKCFRLFTEETFRAMETVSTPEILRMHLGQSLLKLMLLGIPDATEFDFVQSPPKETLSCAIKSLKELGAIDDNGLTDLGRKLAKLSVEPRLGKLILESQEKGIGFEGLVVAALGMTGYNVFFRGHTKEEQDKSDKRKVIFCHPRGDIFTFLGVFKQWSLQPANKRNTWCTQNSINAKSMRVANENIGELQKVIKKELDMKISFGSNSEELVEEHLPRLLAECYKSNLAMFAGHRSVGYIPVHDSGSTLPLHPGSAVNGLRTEPKWIIYEQILQTSRKFLLNVTCLTPNEIELPDPAEMGQHVVAKKEFSNFGPWIIRQLVWKHHGNPRKTDEALKTVLLENGISGTVAFEYDPEKFIIYSQARNHRMLTDYIMNIVSPLRKQLQLASYEYPIVEIGNVRCVLISGCRLRTILMPDDTRCVTVNVVPPFSTTAEIKSFMSQFGEIEDVFQSDQNKRQNDFWGKITFMHYREAKAALDVLSEGAHGFKISANLQKSTRSPTEVNVHISWCKRKAKGFAFVKFKDPNDAIVELLNNARCDFREHRLSITQNKKEPSELYVRNIPPFANQQELQETLQSHMPASPIATVRVIREPPVSTSRKDLEMYQRRIKTKFVDMGHPEDTFNIRLFDSRDKDFTINGMIMFTDVEVAKTVVDECSLIIDGVPVDLVMQYQHTEYIDKDVYAVIKDTLETSIFVLQQQVDGVSIECKVMKGGNVRLSMRSSKEVAFKDCVGMLSDITTATVVDLTTSLEYRLMTSASGQNFLKNITKKHRVLVKPDRMRSTLLIYGKKTNKGLAEVAIQQHLKDTQKLVVKDVSLAGEDRPPGVMKALFLKYGITLERFRTENGLEDVNVSVYRHILNICGEADAVAKARNVVDDIAADLRENNLDIAEASEDDCPVCLCPVDEDHYIAEMCAHRYCRSCVDGMIHHTISSKELPIKCAREDCSELFVLQDIYTLAGKTRSALEPIVSAAIDNFLSTNQHRYQHCITPDCPMVYRVKMGRFTCPSCKITLCTRCKEKYHEGMSCKMNKGLEKDEDYGFKSWMKQSPAHRACCPKCGIGIEKDGGCQRVMCTNCKSHICWKCKKTFSSHGEAYDHLAEMCGGIF